MSTKGKKGIRIVLLAILYFLVQGCIPCLGATTHKAEGEQPEELRIAIVPEKHIFEQRRRYKILSDYLSKMLEVKVSVQIISDHGKICESFLNKHVNAGFLDSLNYVLIRRRASIEPLVKPEWLGGSASNSSLIFARKDSGIFSPKDMKGRSLVLMDRGSALGFLFPIWYFHGVNILSVDKYFSKVIFARNYDAAAWAVYIGEVDIGVTRSDVFQQLEKEYSDFGEQMTVIAKSKELPTMGLTVANDMPLSLKEHLAIILIHMNKTDEGREVLRGFGAITFVRSVDEDYRPVYQMLQEAAINLSGYPCGSDGATQAIIP